MLYQIDLSLAPFDDSELYSDLAVKIHGAAMKRIPPKTARELHTQQYHPFSVFAVHAPQGYIIRASALNDAAKPVTDALARCKALLIYGCNDDRPVPVIGLSAAPALSAGVMGGLVSEKGCRIDFVTPAVIKTNGLHSAKPELCSYFYSVMLKYNAFEHGSLEFGDVQAAFAAVQFGAYQLSSTQHCISGHMIPGMTGFCELLFPADEKKNRLLRLLLAYASYCGIGAKTGQGMGGILVKNLK
jgi:CRISPR-associated endoribonuclease Cas6